MTRPVVAGWALCSLVISAGAGSLTHMTMELFKQETGAFMLLFVESLADLGNPVFIGGNVTVLSTQIWMAVIGEYDQQKGAALSLILLLPTLTVFLLQRYWVSRKSYISVTGKPASGWRVEKSPGVVSRAPAG